MSKSEYASLVGVKVRVRYLDLYLFRMERRENELISGDSDSEIRSERLPISFSCWVGSKDILVIMSVSEAAEWLWNI